MEVVGGPGDTHPASSGQKLPREGALARPAWRGLAGPVPILPWPMAAVWPGPPACLSEPCWHL